MSWRDLLRPVVPGFGRALWHRLLGHAVILAYHRVTTLPPDGDPYRLAVTPATFDAQMAVLRKRFRPVSLYEITEALLSGRPLPPRAVAVTFDDGYADNLLEAAPILARHGIPAAFFITSGMIENREEFWWDDLERIVLASPSLPRRLELGLGPELPEPFRWDAEEACPPSEVLPREGAVFSRTLNSSRRSLFLRLARVLKGLPRERQTACLDALAAWAGAGREVRPERRTMSVEEVSALAATPSFTLGAHTVTHPRLASLPSEAQRREIEGSKRDLEGLLGRAVGMLAYPYGDGASIGGEAPGIAREAGFTLGFAATGGYVRAGVDPFLLPRFFVYEWTEREFLSKLGRLL